jgi:hypothetical protein
MGAVYAMIITEVVLFINTAWYMKAELRKIFNLRSFIGPILGTIVIIAASYLLTYINTWVLMISSIPVYLMIVFALDPSSIKPLRLILSRRQT